MGSATHVRVLNFDELRERLHHGANRAELRVLEPHAVLNTATLDRTLGFGCAPVSWEEPYPVLAMLRAMYSRQHVQVADDPTELLRLGFSAAQIEIEVAYRLVGPDADIPLDELEPLIGLAVESLNHVLGGPPRVWSAAIRPTPGGAPVATEVSILDQHSMSLIESELRLGFLRKVSKALAAAAKELS
jgi:hypothetical protein